MSSLPWTGAPSPHPKIFREKSGLEIDKKNTRYKRKKKSLE
uniref:Uncharacterized protein n=1 Tax=Medicago truncatula TaxID=3880 RepID=A4PU29_MEDTR|nr:hypothetical protein MtrDRAFT_AC144563g40v2 [Medicago truncatula]